MNIDLEKAKEEFLKYTEKFNLEDENIKRKQLHSLRVMKISKDIATKLGLAQEKIELATLIGLLHDIGRFKQYSKIGLGDNIEGFDHGDYGAKILEKNIRKYINDNKYDDIIIKAVKNHNKFAIEEGLTEQEMLFAKIIKDADKIDILYESIYIYNNGKEEQVNKSILSERIYNQFIDKKLIMKEKNVILKYVDDIVCVMAFIYDINFKPSFEILRKKDYINKILDRYDFENKETKEKIKKIRKTANEYIDIKVKE